MTNEVAGSPASSAPEFFFILFFSLAMTFFTFNLGKLGQQFRCLAASLTSGNAGVHTESATQKAFPVHKYLPEF
jgi:hypothetical protein